MNNEEKARGKTMNNEQLKMNNGVARGCHAARLPN